MRVHRTKNAAGERPSRTSSQRIQEERRQLRDLISSLTPYRPEGLEEIAAQHVGAPGVKGYKQGADTRLVRPGAAGWVGPM